VGTSVAVKHAKGRPGVWEHAPGSGNRAKVDQTPTGPAWGVAAAWNEGRLARD